MRPQRRAWLVLAVVGALACSFWRARPAPNPSDSDLPQVAAAPLARLGPGPQEWLEHYLSGFQMRLSPEERRRTAAAIISESERHGLDRDLVLAVIRVESGFNAFARSHMGALGLMQVMPYTGEIVARNIGIEWNGPESLYDPVTNVRIGTAYLAELHARYDDMDRALAAYNWGPGAIDRRLRHGTPMPEKYVTQVGTALEQHFRR